MEAENRDEYAYRVLLKLIEKDEWAPFRGSGNGGLEMQCQYVSAVAYMLVDAMKEQSEGKGIRFAMQRDTNAPASV